MTDTKILKELSNQIGDFVEGLIKNSEIPIVRNCVVESDDGSGNYIVSCHNTRHRVKSRNVYSPGDTVEVMLPNGNWNRAFIVY